MTTIPMLRRSAETDAPLRAKVVAALETGDTMRAIQAARDLLLAWPSTRSARVVASAMAARQSAHAGLRPMRIALLSTYSSEFVRDHLLAWGLASGLALDIQQAPFGTFRQEILDPGSSLYRYVPDVVILATDGSDWVPAAYRTILHGERGVQAVKAWRDEAETLLKVLRGLSSAPVLIHNFAHPAYLALGAADAKQEHGQRATIERLNHALGEVARATSDIHIVDCATLVARHGALNWYDARMRHYARVPIAGAMQSYLAAEYVKLLRALRGLSKKCLIVDLDNTLWGGVLGEEGPLGVALGATYPGSAFVEFQQYLLELHGRGVILGVASKNNPADVDEIFATNKAMCVTQAHFSAMEVHWRSKSQSIADIAARLNIGLEYIVFADDNPAECAEIRRALPAVTVVPLPAQPERYVEALQAAVRHALDFERRSKAWRALPAAFAGGKPASIVGFDRRLLSRVADGSDVRRGEHQYAWARSSTHTEDESVQRDDAPVQRGGNRVTPQRSGVARTVALHDCFGDNGIVGLVMAVRNGLAVEIDTLLLSCRVRRTIETAMLAHVCEWARDGDAYFLDGLVIPTAKNEPARDIYARHGFTKVADELGGSTSWRLGVRDQGIAWPSWLRRSAENSFAPVNA